jgi:hypothetical protein
MAIFGINGTRYALPASRRVWAVADIGEPGRISDVEPGTQLDKEEAHQEIVRNAERLFTAATDTHSHRHYAGDQRSDHCPPAA